MKKSTKKFLVCAVILIVAISVGLLVVPMQTEALLSDYGVDIDFNSDGHIGVPKTSSPQPTQAPTDAGTMQVHFIDVGQGDAIYVQLPDGKSLMIDSGDRFSEVEKKVLGYLEEIGAKNTIDYYILSHSDADHAGSADAVLQNYKVENFYLPRTTTENHTTAVYRDFLEEVAIQQKAGATVNYSIAGEKIESDLYEIEFYMPDEGLYSDMPSGEWDSHEKNAVSSILTISYAGRKIMFTGDSNEDNEEIFCELYEGEESLDVDVLKVAHHGSWEGSSAGFLEITKPEYSVISVGYNKEDEDGNPYNSYGHPHKEAVYRLDDGDGVSGYDGGEVYSTMENGDILLLVSPNGDMDWNFEK